MLNTAVLLAIEIETLWVTDAAGRLLHTRESVPSPAPEFVVARSETEAVVASGSRVPLGVAAQAEALDLSNDPAVWLPRLQALLEAALAPVAVSESLGYVIPPGLSYPHESEVVTASTAGPTAVELQPPAGANWPDDEWQALLAGDSGPWAAAVSGNDVAALCHTARQGPRGAEAGVFTAPTFRGRRLAAAVTAAWASEFPPGSRHLFYSTSVDNLASRQVANRLGLREIGRMWQFSAPVGQNVEP